MVMIDFIHEVPTCPFLKLPEGLSVRLQCVPLKRDLYAVQPPLDGIRIDLEEKTLQPLHNPFGPRV